MATFARDKGLALGHAAISGTLTGAMVRDAIKDCGEAWLTYGEKLAQWLDNGMHSNLPFKVFVKGNSKLPFYSFSVLPVVTCPGAGECASWCYSLKAWRYPAAYFRQLMNTMLINCRKDIISDYWKALPVGITVRLYVDGDFDSVNTVAFWMANIQSRPDIKAYGYSKSFSELIAYGNNSQNKWPENYKLNISSGHNHSGLVTMIAESLPIVRGRFVAVDAGRNATAKDVRKAYGKSAFVCPGKCGECTPKGHACGSDRFQNIDIIIASH